MLVSEMLGKYREPSNKYYYFRFELGFEDFTTMNPNENTIPPILNTYMVPDMCNSLLNHGFLGGVLIVGDRDYMISAYINSYPSAGIPRENHDES